MDLLWHNGQRVPRWDGSDAQRLIKQDVAAGRHLEVLPARLWNERKEYKEFPDDMFRDHGKQEVKAVKFDVCKGEE